jgi:starch-binding outer membrane protein, SusD/RagB family
MKKVIILFIIISFFSACEKLDPQVYDRLSPNNYPKNQEDARTLVTGAYGPLFEGSYWGFGTVQYTGRWAMNEACTDEFACWWGGSVWDTYKLLLWNSNNFVTDSYGPYIKAISNCVNTIAQLEPINMDAALKARYQAEMKGIIALLSYTLYDFYGPTAIVIDPAITGNPNSDYKPERPTKEWMVDFIKKNGREAADALPLSYNKEDYGRITKGTALMVLLKLAMHEKNWQEAAALSKEIMDLNYYQLQDSYQSIFSVQNEMNKEIIFATPASVSDYRSNNYLAHVLPSAYKEPNNIPVQKWGGYKVPWNMYDKFTDANDKRLLSLWATLNTDNGVMNLRTSNEGWAQMGAVPYKYPADPASTGEAHGNDYVIYRYADVLLLRAEALNHLSPLSQEAIDLVNQVRYRSDASLVSIANFTNADAFNDYILDERFRELFMEGHRREDLIRHGKFLSEAQKRGSPYAIESRLLFPIPQWAIDENRKIQQNTGY